MAQADQRKRLPLQGSAAPAFRRLDAQEVAALAHCAALPCRRCGEFRPARGNSGAITSCFVQGLFRRGGVTLGLPPGSNDELPAPTERPPRNHLADGFAARLSDRGHAAGDRADRDHHEPADLHGSAQRAVAARGGTGAFGQRPVARGRASTGFISGRAVGAGAVGVVSARSHRGAGPAVAWPAAARLGQRLPAGRRRRLGARHRVAARRARGRERTARTASPRRHAGPPRGWRVVGSSAPRRPVHRGRAAGGAERRDPIRPGRADGRVGLAAAEQQRQQARRRERRLVRQSGPVDRLLHGRGGAGGHGLAARCRRLHAGARVGRASLDRRRRPRRLCGMAGRAHGQLACARGRAGCAHRRRTPQGHRCRVHHPWRQSAARSAAGGAGGAPRGAAFAPVGHARAGRPARPCAGPGGHAVARRLVARRRAGHGRAWGSPRQSPGIRNTVQQQPGRHGVRTRPGLPRHQPQRGHGRADRPARLAQGRHRQRPPSGTGPDAGPAAPAARGHPGRNRDRHGTRDRDRGTPLDFRHRQCGTVARCPWPVARGDQHPGGHHRAQAGRRAADRHRPATERKPAADGTGAGSRERRLLPLPVRRRPPDVDAGPMRAVRHRRAALRHPRRLVATRRPRRPGPHRARILDRLRAAPGKGNAGVLCAADGRQHPLAVEPGDAAVRRRKPRGAADRRHGGHHRPDGDRKGTGGIDRARPIRCGSTSTMPGSTGTRCGSNRW